MVEVTEEEAERVGVRTPAAPGRAGHVTAAAPPRAGSGPAAFLLSLLEVRVVIPLLIHRHRVDRVFNA